MGLGEIERLLPLGFEGVPLPPPFPVGGMFCDPRGPLFLLPFELEWPPPLLLDEGPDGKGGLGEGE